MNASVRVCVGPILVLWGKCGIDVVLADMGPRWVMKMWNKWAPYGLCGGYGAQMGYRNGDHMGPIWVMWGICGTDVVLARMGPRWVIEMGTIWAPYG